MPFIIPHISFLMAKWPVLMSLGKYLPDETSPPVYYRTIL